MWHQASELAPQYGRRRHMAAFRTLQEASIALATDPSIGLALLHLPVPHEPGIYDRTRGDFSIRAAAADAYANNLALADRSLGELRAAVDSAGLSARTTVMVFGDHGRRSHADGESIADPRVPFVVKLAGQSQGVAYAAPVDLLRVHDLTLEILAGRVSTTSDLSGGSTRVASHPIPPGFACLRCPATELVREAVHEHHLVAARSRDVLVLDHQKPLAVWRRVIV
jgi:Sulfatase